MGGWVGGWVRVPVWIVHSAALSASRPQETRRGLPFSLYRRHTLSLTLCCLGG